jgi:ribosomal protein S27AE
MVGHVEIGALLEEIFARRKFCRECRSMTQHADRGMFSCGVCGASYYLPGLSRMIIEEKYGLAIIHEGALDKIFVKKS